jgi:hypothetical protein
MAKNKMSDLNDHLFLQLERLNDETIEAAQMEVEFKKAKAVSGIAAQIIKSNALTLQAAKFAQQGNLTEEQSNVKHKLLN